MISQRPIGAYVLIPRIVTLVTLLLWFALTSVDASAGQALIFAADDVSAGFALAGAGDGAVVPQAPAAQPAPAQPPAGSGPVIRQTEIRFHPVNESIIEAQTYLYYIRTAFTRPSEGVFVPFNEATEQSLLEDFKRLWATSFLDNLWIETLDEPYENGVVGKRVIYHMEERPRVKIVDYTGSSKFERTKVDEKMKELGISLRLDSFLDEAVVRRVQGIVKGLMAEKGFEYAEVTSAVEPLLSRVRPHLEAILEKAGVSGSSAAVGALSAALAAAVAVALAGKKAAVSGSGRGRPSSSAEKRSAATRQSARRSTTKRA